MISSMKNECKNAQKWKIPESPERMQYLIEWFWNRLSREKNILTSDSRNSMLLRVANSKCV